MKNKPTLCVDFDGVIHSYDKGWQGGEIYGEIVPGFFEWALEAEKHFTLTVYSSRCKDDELMKPMIYWLSCKRRAWLSAKGLPNELLAFGVSFQKPPAWLTIDDRAICFRGNWNAPELQPEAMLAFKPWMAK